MYVDIILFGFSAINRTGVCPQQRSIAPATQSRYSGTKDSSQIRANLNSNNSIDFVVNNPRQTQVERRL